MNQIYNYRNFKTEYYDLSEFPGPKAGEKFKDIQLFNLHGEKVLLSSFFNKPLVIETGSISCPMYAKCVPEMGRLKSEFPNINFAMIYVREAHPGNKLGSHKAINEKISVAKRIKDIYNENRIVLVDDINGLFHKTYGLLPNLIYVISTNGIVLFRGDWNNPKELEIVLKTVGENKVFTKEHFEPAKPTPIVAIKALSKGGIIAVWDFFKALPSLLRLHKQATKTYEKKIFK